MPPLDVTAIVLCATTRGIPPPIALKSSKRRATDEFNEIKARLNYFSPAEGVSLFPSPGTSWEVTAHPYFMEILRSLRERTSKPLRITTNGKKLTPKMVEELAKFKPLYLYLSLNSSSPQRRQRLMRDDKPQIAISAPKLLRDKGIPYAVVIVPWPVDSIGEMCDDLHKTIIYANDCCNDVPFSEPTSSRRGILNQPYNSGQVLASLI